VIFKERNGYNCKIKRISVSVLVIRKKYLWQVGGHSEEIIQTNKHNQLNPSFSLRSFWSGKCILSQHFHVSAFMLLCILIYLASCILYLVCILILSLPFLQNQFCGEA
jgi:hypothetical protein